MKDVRYGARDQERLSGSQQKQVAVSDWQRVQIFEEGEDKKQAGRGAEAPSPGEFGQSQRWPVQDCAETFERGGARFHASLG